MKSIQTNIKDEVINNLNNNLCAILETPIYLENYKDITSYCQNKLGLKPLVVELTDYNPLRYIHTSQPGSKGLRAPKTNEEIGIKIRETFKNRNFKMMILESTPGNDLTPYLSIAKENNYPVLVLVNQEIKDTKCIAFKDLDSLNEEFKKYPNSDDFKNDSINRIRYKYGSDSEYPKDTVSNPKLKL